MPITIDASPPSVSLTPPTMSICHGSMGRDRSPALVVASLAPAPRRLDEVVAHERPVDPRAAGRRGGLVLGEVVEDRLGSPGGGLTAQSGGQGRGWRGHRVGGC